MADVLIQGYEPAVEASMRLFYQTLSEKDRRRYVAVEAQKLGRGGQTYIASVVGCSRATVASGIAELNSLPDAQTQGRTRRPGGGRKKATVNEPQPVEFIVKNHFLPSIMISPVGHWAKSCPMESGIRFAIMAT